MCKGRDEHCVGYARNAGVRTQSSGKEHGSRAALEPVPSETRPNEMAFP